MSRRWTAFVAGKQLNGRALLILLLVLVLMGGSTYLLHGFQIQRNASGLLEQAGLTEEGNKEQTVNYLKQYLGLVPGDIDAKARLGMLMAKNKAELRGAFEILEQVLIQKQDRADVRREVARIAPLLGRYRECKEHLDVLLKSSAEPDAELLHLSALCEVGLREYEKAEGSYRQAILKAPRQTDIVFELAFLLRARLDKPAKADEVVEDLVLRDGRSAQTRLEVARYYYRFRQPEKAWKHLRFALDELRQPTEEVLLLAAEVALGRGEVEAARELFQEGRQRFPKNVHMSRGLAQVEIRTGNSSKALAILEPNLRELPKDPVELWSLASLLIDAHAVDQARTVIKQLDRTNSGGLVAYLEGRLCMEKKEWGEAAKLFDRARIDHRFSSTLAKHANVLLAECSERLLNSDQQLEALQRAVGLDPNWVPAERALALALAATGKHDLAITRLRKLAVQSVPVKQDLARLLVERNRRLPAAQRDWSEVDRLLVALPLAAQESVAGKLFRAEVLALKGKFEEARKLAETERDRDPAQVAPWLFLFAADRQGGSEKAFDLLDQAERRAGKRVEWSLARILLWLKAGPMEARKQLPKLLENADQFQGKDRDRLLLGLAEAFSALGESATARRLWSKVALHTPDNLQVHFALFDSAIQAKEADDAQGQLRHIRRIEGGEGAFTAYAEGALRLLLAQPGDKTKVTEAQTFLARAASLRPSWSQVPLLEGRAFELLGQKDKALDKYRNALERGEGRLAVVQHVLQLMQEQRLFVEADALLRKLPEAALATPELGRLAAQLTLLNAGGEGQDPKAARQQALSNFRKVAADSKDHRDHLMLGQIASLAGNTQEAEKSFRRACALKETAPESWIALIFFLAGTDPKQAEAELARAQQSLLREQAALVLAVGYEALGQIDKAEKHVQAQLDAQPSDPIVLRQAASFFARQRKEAKAEKCLRTLLRPDARASEAMTAWARRSLALVLAIQGGYDRFKEAESILKKPGNNEQESQEDRLARASVLATRPDHRAEAIEAIESLTNPTAMPDEARFLLARLYEADGNWQKAEIHLLTLVHAHEQNPVYLERYVSGLLRQHRTQEAQVWVQKLEKLLPKALRTTELRVHILMAAKKTNEAVQLVQEYASAKDALLEVAAQWLEMLGQFDEAEKTYRAFAASSKRPESILLLALHLGRRQKDSEALAICEKAWADSAPEPVARVSVTVLRTGQAAPSQWQAVEANIAAAIKKTPKTLGLPLVLAELYEYQNRPDDSIRLYRGLLKQHPENAVFLNNLAFLLALHQGETTEPLRMVNRAIELAGPIGEMLDTRAVIYLKNREPRLATDDLTQAIAQAPTPLRYFHLVQARRLAEDRIGAADAWQKAVDLGLKASDVHPMEREAYGRLAAELNLNK
jgi:Tfp pilus assembly protein PilF